MARVVVTGGAGFIGSHVCDALVGRGDHVICVDNLITGRWANVSHLASSGSFEFVDHDVSRPITIDGPVDAVMQLASPASPADFDRLPIQILKVGSLGTHNCLGLAMAKGARFFLASTSEVYGDPLVHPQPETYPGNVNHLGVRGAYDESKRFAESITMAYHRIHGVDVRIIRIFNTYGPRMRPDDGRVISNFLTQALRNRPLTVYGDGSHTRCFCHVDDQVEGHLALLDGSTRGPVNIGSDVEFTVLELAELVVEVTNSSSEIVFEPLPADDPRHRRPDLTLARTALGWEPRTSLRDGLVSTARWFHEALGL